MPAALLHYRAWQGNFRRPLSAVWPIARVALAMLLRRRLFWLLYAAGLLLFLMFFFGTYLFAWAEAQLSAAPARPGGFGPDPRQILRFVRQAMRVLGGGQETFQYFFGYQSAMVVVMLALAGSVMVGNDFTHRSLIFYLAKPIHRWHYLLGKCFAVAAVVTLMTTVPALVLFAQHVLDDWNYLLDPNYFTQSLDLTAGSLLDPDTGVGGPAGVPLLLGILGYGALLAAFLSILLVATASWMRRTMPLIMVWMALFFFLRVLANILVEGLKYDVHWRLLDLWNDLALLGQACLGFAHDQIGPKPQPEFWEAALVLLGVCTVCLIYLNRRTRSVEIVR
jgi:ABC-2 type transport system permease protein